MPQRGEGDDRPSIEERIEELQRVVSLLVYKLDKEFGVTLDFTPRSISYLDAVLTEANHRSGRLTPGLYLSIGGYVGETLIRNFGGEWRDVDGALCVEIVGEGHSRYLRVFDWVQAAHEEPRTQSLTYRMQALVGTARAGWEGSDSAGAAVA